MKNRKLLACLLALATVAGAVSALADSPAVSLGVGVQYWDAKDLDTIDKDGFYGANLILRLRPSDYLGIDFRTGCSGVWDAKSFREDGVKYETDVTFTCVPLEAGLVLMLPLNDSVSLYGGPGVGYYIYDIDIEQSSKHHHHYHEEWSKHIKLDNDLGWYAVAGLNIRLATNVSIFGEARYTDTETSLKHSKGDSTFDCSGFGAQAGIMIDF